MHHTNVPAIAFSLAAYAAVRPHALYRMPLKQVSPKSCFLCRYHYEGKTASILDAHGFSGFKRRATASELCPPQHTAHSNIPNRSQPLPSYPYLSGWCMNRRRRRRGLLQDKREQYCVFGNPDGNNAPEQPRRQSRPSAGSIPAPQQPEPGPEAASGDISAGTTRTIPIYPCLISFSASLHPGVVATNRAKMGPFSRGGITYLQ